MVVGFELLFSGIGGILCYGSKKNGVGTDFPPIVAFVGVVEFLQTYAVGRGFVPYFALHDLEEQVAFFEFFQLPGEVFIIGLQVLPIVIERRLIHI